MNKRKKHKVFWGEELQSNSNKSKETSKNIGMYYTHEWKDVVHQFSSVIYRF